MKIGIIGTGFTGLTVAYELSKTGHQVTVFEKNSFAGGLASGIRQVVDDYPDDWGWDLERFYHHWFSNDDAIFNLIKAIGAKDQLVIRRPITASWYQGQAWQLDSPLSLLRFSPLPFPLRLRMGAVIAYLKYICKPRKDMPWHVSTEKFENVTTDKWLRKHMGGKTYEAVWQPLMKGKFKNFHDQINMTWFWARIHKRTPRLAYFEGGFGKLVDILVEKIKEQGGTIRFNQQINSVETRFIASLQMQNGTREGPFDKLIITTPPSVLTQLIPNLPMNYQTKLTSNQGLGALSLILVLDKPLLGNGTYWLNIAELGFPFLAVVEHTNFVDSKYYGGKHIVYIGDYLPTDHPHMQIAIETHGDVSLLEKFTPYLQQINPQFDPAHVKKSWLFKETFAQPIVGLNHAEKILPIETPIPNVYLASMSQVYPWDRGTNYAVELGKRVAQLIVQGI